MGYLVKAFRELGVEAYGIDINEYAVSNGVIDTLLIADATKLPFRNETFDVVTALDLIEHLEHPEKFVSEVYRVSP
ncbi:Methylase involved in ubiquinone/menaquinone biosynthesis [Archaeoglobus fulgidus DSM 8774]|uniref:Methylase involved in ubiquinone/menaquinone biosynthesis n=1 Tax=Archaeoglobus fulgidus DSM 8774 TaxID=1344584 RepID=A0A075WD03_ARCFL|nr:class I SAM-dependent methyltransferase [Archaeoglobus fulgidus]AIG97482.1 Methylase involved in ubiquinone/menaquinone biosynthesis [Archaeoglobus fulgidus DSM 8774]